MQRGTGWRWVALGLAALGVAPGAGRGDSLIRLTPEEQTVQRIEALGRSLLGWAVDRTRESLDGSVTTVELAALEREWNEPVECAVPAGRSPSTPVEIASYFSDATARDVLEDLPELDGWGQPIEVYFDPSDRPRRPLIVLRSPGANGGFEGPAYERGTFEPSAPTDDVVWVFDGLCRQSESTGREEERRRLDLSPDAVAQKRTMADFRNVGTAILSWLTDQVTDPSYEPVPDDPARADPCAGIEPVPGGPAVECQPSEVYVLPEPVELVSFDELERILHPSDTFFYMNEIPRTDGWGRPYEVYLNLDNLLSTRFVALRSAGSDGLYGDELYEIGPFDASESDRDIVWADGFFVRWPVTKGTEGAE